MENYKVYMHTFPNGKKYIGMTKREPTVRWGNGTNYNQEMTEAVAYYGWENVLHEILAEHLTEEQARAEETRYIIELGTTNSEKGYNKITGAKKVADDEFVWINFRSTEEEKERLKKDAHRHEMTVTEYLKWLIEREREVKKNDARNV